MNKVDYTEYEAKFYPVDKELYRKRLVSIGAVLLLPERKMIRVVADWKDNPVLPRHAHIRVRDEGDLIRLSLKTFGGRGGKMSDQKEIDVKVSDFDKTIKIIEATGIKFTQRMENLREEWAFNGTQITIDTFPCLETYSEIEAESEEKVKEIADLLGFDWSKKIIAPWPEVCVKVYGLSTDEVMEKITNLSFENNPFEGMKKVWAPKTQQEG
jgi:adenylate cyclase class IV